MANIYFDTEFTGLRHKTELVSIGVVTDAGDKFYAEISNVNWEDPLIDDGTKKFLADHVKSYLKFNGQKSVVKKDGNNWTVCDNKSAVGYQFLLWLDEVMPSGEAIIPVSDVMYYDMVLLQDMINAAITNTSYIESVDNVAKRISPAGIDINRDIAINGVMSGEKNELDPLWAFNYSREDILKDYGDPDGLLDRQEKHNALYDAEIIRAIYLKLV